MAAAFLPAVNIFRRHTHRQFRRFSICMQCCRVSHYVAAILFWLHTQREKTAIVFRRRTVCARKDEVHFLSRDRKSVCTPFLSLVGKGRLMPCRHKGDDVHFLSRDRKRTKRTRIRGRDFDFPSPYLSLSFETTKENSSFSLGSLRCVLLGGHAVKIGTNFRAVGKK